MPLPTATPFLVKRVRVLRAAVAALARAFLHQAEEGDHRLLLDASDSSPLVHWAMRYGAAVASVDAGELTRARALLLDAPAWPGESCFSEFHREISAEVARRERAVDEGASPDSPASGPAATGDDAAAEVVGMDRPAADETVAEPDEPNESP